jgi:N-acyl-D-amino-acid deacylase
VATTPPPHRVRIRGGWIVDGTGAPGREGDVALCDGRIESLDATAREGEEVVDATGCWVTPGFIDPHTHLDAQLCWDASGSPSNRHGVTTVVLGLCGFGVAPCPDGGGEYLLRALEVVEEIPYSSTSLGVPFEWRTWREFRNYIAGRPLGVNVAGFVPHSALRYFAMGERARSEVASPDDRARMVRELEDAFDAGAIGFATSRGPNHVDGYLEPVPSRVADDAELQALVDACRGRIWQINVETKFSRDADALIAEISRYAEWTRNARARLTWTPFYAEPGETVWCDVLAHNRELNEAGIEVAPQITAVPITLLLRFNEQSMLTAISGWEDTLRGYFKLTAAERMARLAESGVRRAMKRTGGDPKHPLTPDFALWTFTLTPSRPELAGQSLQQAADAEGIHPVDLLCDQVIADELATLIDVPVLNRSLSGVLEFLDDPRTLLGLGDAGAHVTTVTNYRYPTFMLAELVQARGLLPLERAVNRLTRAPARMLGLQGLGELREGATADVCVIDPAQLSLGPPSLVHDLPGSSPRLLQHGHGYRAVFVNGCRTINCDEPTGATPGAMIRARPA